jgi:hypothetical protein
MSALSPKRTETVKFWLAEVSLASSLGFRSAELSELRRLVFEHRPLFQEKWDEHFGR